MEHSIDRLDDVYWCRGLIFMKSRFLWDGSPLWPEPVDAWCDMPVASVRWPGGVLLARQVSVEVLKALHAAQ